MRNLEFKTRIDNPNGILTRARAAGFELWGDLRQSDAYFHMPTGRLKLRTTAGLQAELICYERDEAATNRFSDYEIALTPDPAALLKGELSG